MNIMNKNFIQVLVIVAMIVIAPVAFANHNDPTIETLGPTEVKENSAVLQAFYSSRDAEYLMNEAPYVVFEYGEDSSVDDGATRSRLMLPGTRTVSQRIENLEEDEIYYYRAVLYTKDGIVKGDKYRFRTLSNNSGFDDSSLPVVESTTVVDTTSSGSGSTSSTTSTTSTVPEKTIVTTGGNDNLALSLENGDDEVRQGDTVTYEIKLENISGVELENLVLIFEIPEEMTVMSVAGAHSSERGDEIQMSIGDLKPGEDESIKITGRMRGNSSDDQVIARVDAIYGVGDIRNQEIASAFDIDEYNGINNAALGASAIGAGFLPNTLFGWILVMILLVGLIYVARWYFYHREKDRYDEFDGYPYEDEPQYS